MAYIARTRLAGQALVARYNGLNGEVLGLDCSVQWLVLWCTQGSIRLQRTVTCIAGYYEFLAVCRGICCRFNDLQCRDKSMQLNWY